MPMCHAISSPRAFYPRDHGRIRPPRWRISLTTLRPVTFMGLLVSQWKFWMIDVSSVLIKQGITYFIGRQYVKEASWPMNPMKLNDRPHRHDSPYTWGVNPSAACFCFSQKPLHKFPKAHGWTPKPTSRLQRQDTWNCHQLPASNN